MPDLSPLPARCCPGWGADQESALHRKLSPEELERKRQEMLQNARWREEERLDALRRHAREDEREHRLEQLDSRDGRFIQ